MEPTRERPAKTVLLQRANARARVSSVVTLRRFDGAGRGQGVERTGRGDHDASRTLVTPLVRSTISSLILVLHVKCSIVGSRPSVPPRFSHPLLIDLVIRST